MIDLSNIDWAATGAMIGGVATCIAAVCAIVIACRQNKLTKQIADKQSSQQDLQIKIALFEKRYDAYKCFLKYLSIGNHIFKNDDEEFDITHFSNLDDLVNTVFKTYECQFQENQIQKLKSERFDNKQAIEQVAENIFLLQKSILDNDRKSIQGINFLFDADFEMIETYIIKTTQILEKLIYFNMKRKLANPFSPIDDINLTQTYESVKQIYEPTKSLYNELVECNFQQNMEEQLKLIYSSFSVDKSKKK